MSIGQGLFMGAFMENELGYTQKSLALSQLHKAVNAKIWIMADSTKIYISEMSGNHIKNCVAMLKRNISHYEDEPAEIASRYLRCFGEELEKRYQPKDPAEGFFDEMEADGI